MTTMTIYNIALVTHLTGLVLLAGATIQNFSLSTQFWKYIFTDPARGMTFHEVGAKSPLFPIGGITLILSGFTMMFLTKGVYGEQIWFQIKFALVLVIIVNGVFMGRLQNKRLGKLLQDGAPEDSLLKVKNTLNRFHFAQLALFLTIFCLSVFKFN